MFATITRRPCKTFSERRYMAKRLRYNTQAMKRRDQIIVVCPYNDAVDCNMRDFGDEWYCHNCGWNPKEQNRRHLEPQEADGFVFRILEE